MKIMGFASLLALIGITACSDQRVAGGSTDVETGGVVGLAAQAADGQAASGALILVQPTELADWTQRPSPDTVKCDSNGRFVVNSLKPGSYALESYHPGHGTRALRTFNVQTSQNTDLGKILLHTPASMHLLMGGNAPSALWLQGLNRSPRFVGDTLILDSIPAGTPLQLRLRLGNRDTIVNLDALSPGQSLQMALPR